MIGERINFLKKFIKVHEVVFEFFEDDPYDYVTFCGDLDCDNCALDDECTNLTYDRIIPHITKSEYLLVKEEIFDEFPELFI